MRITAFALLTLVLAAGPAAAQQKESETFDRTIAFSRGGTSMTATNVQLLCARHNLEKHDSIV